MGAVAKNPRLPFTLREVSGYVFILLFLALGGSFVYMFARMIEPHPDLQNLGEVAAFDRERPTVLHLTAADGSGVTVWVTYVNGEWRAYNGFTPDANPFHCMFGWQPVTSRFEDPCSGFKYTRAGEYIPEYHFLEYPYAQDLNGYTVQIENGQILVNLSRPISGRIWYATPPPYPRP